MINETEPSIPLHKDLDAQDWVSQDSLTPEKVSQQVSDMSPFECVKVILMNKMEFYMLM